MNAERVERVAYVLCLTALGTLHLSERWRWTVLAVRTYLIVPELSLLDLLPHLRPYFVTASVVAGLALQHWVALRLRCAVVRAAHACWLILAAFLPTWLVGWVPLVALAWTCAAGSVRWLARKVGRP